MFGWRMIFLLLLNLLFQTQVYAELLSFNLSGSVFEYWVQQGDSLTKIGARFGTSTKVLANENGLSFYTKLTPLQILTVNNRHIVPVNRTGNLMINIPQKMLFLFDDGEFKNAYPVGLGKPTWPTPLGEFSIQNIAIDKTWIVPKSIQDEMRLEGKVVKTLIPPGPDNPLGKYWIGLSLSGIGIHGTIAPASIYQFQSHGCIRLSADDIEKLFMQITSGEKGEIIYEPLLLAEIDGHIFLEVHPDIYQLSANSIKVLENLAQENMLTERIDWSLARDVLMLQEGVARDVTLTVDVEIN